MEFLKCVLYIAVLGILAGLIGNALPRCWFHGDQFPYKSFSWEQDGKIYRKLRIQKWKDRVPDMSKINPAMYRKKVDTGRSCENLNRLIQETCIAEMTHDILMVLSFGVVKIWPGIMGVIAWICCILGNLPFVLIQRYNRPRLQRALSRMEARGAE